MVEVSRLALLRFEGKNLFGKFISLVFSNAKRAKIRSLRIVIGSMTDQRGKLLGVYFETGDSGPSR